MAVLYHTHKTRNKTYTTHRSYQNSFDDVLGLALEKLFVGLVVGDDEAHPDGDGTGEAGKSALPHGGL